MGSAARARRTRAVPLRAESDDLGLIFVLFGEALALRSLAHGVWAAAFLALNAVYIPLVEEPQLARRFGEPYREYCRHVRRFLPRLGPWTP